MNNQQGLLLQLMEGLNANPSDTPSEILLKLRPMLSEREQKFIDLMIKFQEILDLMDEIQAG